MNNENLPTGICSRCLAHAEKLGSHKLPAIYCEHNKAGAVLMPHGEGKMWRIYTPIPAHEFQRMVEHAIKAVGDNIFSQRGTSIN